jgi:hypothetical protein
MIKNSEHLKQVLQNILKVKGVYKAVRARGRTGGTPEIEQAAKAEVQ